MERNGIIAVGNWLVDSVKFIARYPAAGNLTTITHIEEGLGGCAHNVLVDLARMQSGLPLYAGGCIGTDRYGRMALDAIARYDIHGDNMVVRSDVPTSYTDVMSETEGNATRTFFHCRGANALLSAEQVLSSRSQARIFHLGYLLLLDQLDAPDPQYGVVAARVLDGLHSQGYQTSVDVVSEEGDRFRQVVLPCLKYIDYLIVNEIEAGACCGMSLRDEAGRIDLPKVRQAAAELLRKGVRSLCAIHFPEGGIVVTKEGEQGYAPSDAVPKERIVSAVGAGDAFCAGVLYAIHEGWPLEQMLRFANACARFNLLDATSTGGAPTLTEIQNYLNRKTSEL